MIASVVGNWSSSKLRQLRRAEHYLVAHQIRRHDLRVAADAVRLGRGVDVEHERRQRALEPRELRPSAPRSGSRTASPPSRSPSGPAPRRSRSAAWACWSSRASAARRRGAPPCCRARPCPPAPPSRGRLGMTDSASCSALSAAACAFSPSASASFSAATSAISAAALASSLAPLALPISFDAALRRACASCSRVMTSRRVSSSAISSAANLTSPPGSSPRFRNPASNACGLSRIHLMSNTALASRSTSSPRRRGPSAEAHGGSLVTGRQRSRAET